MICARSAALLAVPGCRREVSGADPVGETSREQTVAGVRFLELFSQGADETSPLPGIGHTIASAMRDDLVAHVRAVVVGNGATPHAGR